MARIKVCPGCKTHNAANAMQCSNCGRDIGIVKAKDEKRVIEEEEEERREKELEEQRKKELEEQEREVPGNNAGTQEPTNDMPDSNECIICEECGHKNATNRRKCDKCGASLSGIPISPVNSQNSRPQSAQSSASKATQTNYAIQQKVYLVSVDGGLSLELGVGEIILGRLHTGADYLQYKSYVGRMHAKITRISDGIYIEDLHSSNGTFINGQRLEAGMARPLCTGDIIGLGGDSQIQTEAAFLRIQKI